MTGWVAVLVAWQIGSWGLVSADNAYDCQELADAMAKEQHLPKEDCSIHNIETIKHMKQMSMNWQK